MAIPSSTITKQIAVASDGVRRTWRADGSLPLVTPEPSAAAISSTAIQLGLVTEAGGSALYRVRRSLAGANSWTVIENALTAVEVGGYVDFSLSASTAYDYQLQAYDGYETTPWSASATDTTPASGGGSGISSISGTFASGNTLTISGSGLSSAGGTPVKAEDFESGSLGASLTTLGFKTSIGNGGLEPSVTSSQAYAGTRCGWANCNNGGDSAAYLDGLATEELYVSLMMKGTLNSGSPNTTKGVRTHADQGPNVYTSNPGFTVQEPFGQYSTNDHRIGISKNNDSSDNGTNYYTSDVPIDTWVRQEYYFKHSSPGGLDGIVQYFADLALKIDEQNIETRNPGITALQELVMLPFYWGNGGKGSFFYDLFYVAKGAGCRARFEVGDSAVYGSCTKREILPATSRSASSAVVDVMATSFTSGQTVHIYALDDSGNVVGSPYSMVAG